MGDALGAGELAGADAEDAAESAQEGEAANAEEACEVGEAGALSGVGGEVVRGTGDEGGLGVGARGGEAGLATLAGTESGEFGGGGGGEEADVVARGAAAGTAWAAVDFGGLDGVDELAVGAGVAREDLLPLATGKETGRGDGWSGFDGWARMRHFGCSPVAECLLRSAREGLHKCLRFPRRLKPHWK